MLEEDGEGEGKEEERGEEKCTTLHKLRMQPSLPAAYKVCSSSQELITVQTINRHPLLIQLLVNSNLLYVSVSLHILDISL